ncbi:Mediator of RNA polymerase II transcription subunit 29 [Blattella germanica]|nr:Mediator of RNA polymerase II transcription subunit 29 [Blattella germanica]
MNLPPMQQPGPGVMPQVQQQPGPGTPQQAQQMQQPMPQQQQEKLDNISKVKSLITPLRESLAVTLKNAAATLQQNNLKTSIECLSQGAASQRYLPLQVALTRTDPMPGQEILTYPQYLATVRAQVGFAKEVHDMLVGAAQNVSPGE